MELKDYEDFSAGDKAIIVVLDSSTAVIGEGSEVEVIKVEDSDILVEREESVQAWVTKYHLEKC